MFYAGFNNGPIGGQCPQSYSISRRSRAVYLSIVPDMSTLNRKTEDDCDVVEPNLSAALDGYLVGSLHSSVSIKHRAACDVRPVG